MTQSTPKADPCMSKAFIQPLREHHPPLITPEPRLYAFIAEVFSTVSSIYLGHAELLDRLLERQRIEWPLVSAECGSPGRDPLSRKIKY